MQVKHQPIKNPGKIFKKGCKIQPPESWLKTNLPISNILKKMVDKCVDTKTIDP